MLRFLICEMSSERRKKRKKETNCDDYEEDPVLDLVDVFLSEYVLTDWSSEL